jgi:hypothetical protein
MAVNQAHKGLMETVGGEDALSSPPSPLPNGCHSGSGSETTSPSSATSRSAAPQREDLDADLYDPDSDGDEEGFKAVVSSRKKRRVAKEYIPVGSRAERAIARTIRRERKEGFALGNRFGLLGEGDDEDNQTQDEASAPTLLEGEEEPEQKDRSSAALEIRDEDSASSTGKDPATDLTDAVEVAKLRKECERAVEAAKVAKLNLERSQRTLKRTATRGSASPEDEDAQDGSGDRFPTAGRGRKAMRLTPRKPDAGASSKAGKKPGRGPTRRLLTDFAFTRQDDNGDNIPSPALSAPPPIPPRPKAPAAQNGGNKKPNASHPTVRNLGNLFSRVATPTRNSTAHLPTSSPLVTRNSLTGLDQDPPLPNPAGPADVRSGGNGC